jgi:tetratricopeptide (TPR) repeat protein
MKRIISYCAFLLLTYVLLALPVDLRGTDARHLIEEGDRLYADRSDLNNAFTAIQKYKEALQKDPASYDAMWKIAKTNFFLAEFLNTKKEKKPVVKEGVEYAKMAVQANSTRVEGHFWLGVLYTKVGEVRGILKALFLLKPIKKEIRRAIQLDDSYEAAGAYVVLGRVYAILPGILGGSNKKARRLLEKARGMAPKNAMAILFLAEVYWDIDEKSLAIKTLEELIELEPDPLFVPETLQKQQHARILLEKYRGDL